MAKRFTDTEKWKKPFIRGLQGAYKLLWFYILDDCDHAGIWQVDFEVARIRTGEEFDEQTAIKSFGDRIEIFANGSKWFLKDFIEFQYGELSEKNRLHLSVINLLKKNKLGAYKGLISPQGQIQGQGNGQGQEGVQGDLSIIIKAKYLGESPKVVNGVDGLKDHFSSTDQLNAIIRAGWIDFEGFMKRNPMAFFNDSEHLYNAFRSHNEKQNESTKTTTGTTRPIQFDGKKYNTKL